MKTNPRMTDLFRGTTEFFLTTTVVALVAAALAKQSNLPPTPLANQAEHASIAKPGDGQVAIVALKDTEASVEFGQQTQSLGDFLQHASPAGSVVLRLNGPKWRELTKLIRARDLHFTVETDP